MPRARKLRNTARLLAGLILSLATGALFVCPPADAARGKSTPHARTHRAGRAASRASQRRAGGQPRQAKAQPRTPSQVSNAYAGVPLGFEANHGQTDSAVRFLSRGDGFNLFLTPQEAVVVLHRPDAGQGSSHKSVAARPQARPSSSEVVRMKLAGANPRPDVLGLEELPGRSSYLVGKDPAGWHTSIPAYGKVKYREVYPGVDVVYYGNQRQLEYDFHLAPGSSADVIRLSFEGARRLRIDDRGNLVLKMRGGELRQSKPFVYQEMEDGTRREIEGRYVLAGGAQVRFAVGSYDRTKPLVIDPALSYSTYLGGSGADYGRGIAVDNDGNLYVAGYTQSPNFPTAGAVQPSLSGTAYDAFVLKLNSTGTALLYSTYLGGANNDFGLGLAIDGAGCAYVAGETLSPNFPTVNAVQGAFGGGTNDAFVAKLNASGTALVYSTYLGGGGGSELAYSLAVDNGGSAYVVGFTQSTDFPTANPYQAFNRGGVDAFVSKLSASGTALAYSTYLGGTGDDWALAVAADGAGNVYLTGETVSSNFPLANAFQASTQGLSHAFVTKMDASGTSLVYSTYLGGGGPEAGHGIAVDGDGNAYVAGETWSTNFPTVNPAQATFGGGNNDGFVSKLNPAGSALVYSTYVGGSAYENLRGLAVDAAGHAYVTGETTSTNFPLVNPVQQDAAGSDAFVSKLSPAGNAFNYSTYVGGSSDELGWEIAAEPAGHKAYVVGWTFSPDFPLVGPFQQGGGSSDVFVLKLTGYSIKGRVSDAAGTGYGSVSIALSGSQARTTRTDAGGFYAFPDLPAGGNYTVTPSGLTATPASQTFNNLTGDRTANFSVVTYSISGRVRDAAGVGVGGVSLSLSGSQTLSTETDESGFYSFANVPAGGSYTVTPSKTDPVLTYTFAPTTRSYTSMSGSQVADFTATASTQSTLYPIADAYVQDGASATATFGAATSLKVRTDTTANSGNNRDAYLKFDVSAVTRNVTNAKLRIYASLSAAGSAATSAYPVAGTNWVETGAGAITWNNRPARGATALAGATANVTSTAFATYDIDVTDYVKTEKNAGRDVISLALHNPASTTLVTTINSREAAANKPQLIVTTGSSANPPPTVTLTAPADGSSFTAPGVVTVSASAGDGDGISKVEFYAGTQLIGSATASPYQITWGDAPAGSYSLTAVATDRLGASSRSAASNIAVNPPNNPPVVSLASPADGATFAAGSNVAVSANAGDGDGTISKVEFFAGTTLIGTATAPASGSTYSITWANANSGGHALTARATDNAGATTTSAAVNVSVVSQTGLSPVADAYVGDGASAAANFGTAADLQAQVSSTAGNNRESHLKYDLTTVSGITQARIRLYGRLNDASAANVTAAVHPVAATGWTETGITWNTKPAAGATALASVTVTNNVAQWYEWDVTSYVKAEKAAGRNVVGFVVKAASPAATFATFNSKEATASRPQLVLRTTQARSALLYTSSTTLGAGDAAVRTRLQNLGFAVTVIAASKATSVTTAQADGKSVVLISSTVAPANVANKFRHVAVPVVTWEFDLLDDQGMTGTVSGTDFGTSATAQSQLTITDASHPMAAGLTANVGVVSTASVFTWGKPNANASRIASLTGDPTRVSIFGYDAGAAMPGLEAPARRVGLFMSDTTAGSFTAQGGSLFDAAVKWAAGTNTAPTISGLSPASGPAGTSVTILGVNFGPAQGGSTLTFNGVTATPTSWGDGAVVAAVPSFAATGPVVITVGGVASNALVFAVGETDTDGDGLPDNWELQHFGNLSQGAGGDADGDGLTNLQEYQQGRNPNRSALADSGDFVNLKVHTPLRP